MHKKITKIIFGIFLILPVDISAHEGNIHFHLIDLFALGLVILLPMLVILISKNINFLIGRR
tara:strand:+ start:512 stop:697 length:186 start_codon:yes stop_codon:yes gene_type:complete